MGATNNQKQEKFCCVNSSLPVIISLHFTPSIFPTYTYTHLVSIYHRLRVTMVETRRGSSSSKRPLSSPSSSSLPTGKRSKVPPFRRLFRRLFSSRDSVELCVDWGLIVCELCFFVCRRWRRRRRRTRIGRRRRKP